MIRSFQRKIGKLVMFIGMYRRKPALRVPLPDYIELEPTTRCNATCGTCSRSSLAGDNLKNDLSLETMHKVLDTLPDLIAIRLIGLGETFLNPHIEDILKLARAKSIKIWMITNGSLLLDQRIRNLIHDYVYDVSISIDSTDPDEFSRLRPMGKIGLTQVIAGTRLLIRETNQGRSNVIIGINSTVSHENYQNLPEIGSLCIDLSTDYLAVSFVENWLMKGDTDYQATSIRINQSLQCVSKIHTILKKQQFRLALRGILVGYKIPKRRIGNCQWPYRSVHITAEGNVNPCCTRTQPHHGLFNILTDDFEKNWNGPAYQELRLAHMRKDTLNPICGSCPL